MGSDRVARPFQTHAQGSLLIIRDDFGADLAGEVIRRAGGVVAEGVYGTHFRRLGPRRWEIDPRQGGDFERLLTDAGPVREIIFLAGLHDPTHPVVTVEALHEVEEKSVLALLRLVQAWAARSAGQTAILRVVTNGAQVVRDADRPQPWRSATLGLAQVVRQEFSLLTSFCLDLPTACRELSTVAALGTWLDAATEEGKWHEVAYREGRWYRRRLVQMGLPPVEHLPLRSRGVYLIVGGAGGLGMAVARYLARTVQAQLVLMGRSLETDTQSQVREIEQLGGSSVLAGRSYSIRGSPRRRDRRPGPLGTTRWRHPLGPPSRRSQSGSYG